MKLSIIMPVLNGLEYTKTIMEQLKANLWEQDYEIIVIDNASNDGTEEYFKELDNKKVRYYRQSKNIFVNPAWNLGVGLAKGKYVIIINNDILIKPGFEVPLLTHLKDNIMITSPIYTFGDEPFNGQRTTKNRYNPHNINGHCFCMRKEDWIPIPDEIKLWFGDNWIYENMIRKGKIELPIHTSKIHHYESKTVNSKNKMIDDMKEQDKTNWQSFGDKYFKNQF